jgi:hypothetical protein
MHPISPNDGIFNPILTDHFTALRYTTESFFRGEPGGSLQLVQLIVRLFSPCFSAGESCAESFALFGDEQNGSAPG